MLSVVGSVGPTLVDTYALMRYLEAHPDERLDRTVTTPADLLGRLAGAEVGAPRAREFVIDRRLTTGDVQLVAELPATTGPRVSLVGDMPDGGGEVHIPLVRVRDRIWTASAELPPGQLPYRFVADGRHGPRTVRRGALDAIDG
jgi:hypothetical protein